jgi:WD40 repeat protein
MIAVAGETSGYVSLYDLRMCFTDSGMNASQPLARFLDEGTVRCTALKWSPTGQYLATGSDAGIVNIYDGRAIRGQASTKASGESVTPRERNVGFRVESGNTDRYVRLSPGRSSALLRFSSETKRRPRLPSRVTQNVSELANQSDAVTSGVERFLLSRRRFSRAW